MNHTKSRNAKNVIRGAIMFVILLMNHACLAQKEAPSWLNTGYVPLENSYIKVFCGGFAYTETQAKELSTIEIVKDRDMYTGGSYQWANGCIVEKESGRIVVKANILDEYTEKQPQGGYKVYLLVQTATHPDNALDNVYVGDKYPFSARVFVPGMAQMYKGSTGKGAAFITGEVLFVGGIATTQLLCNYYTKKMPDASYDMGKYYEKMARICQISQYACIGGAVALYLWNIIDGAFAKGRPYVSVDGKMLTFSPYVSSNSTGIAFNLRF